MASRENILSKLKTQIRKGSELPDLVVPPAEPLDLVTKLTTVLTNIGGRVVRVSDWKEILDHTQKMLSSGERAITTIPELDSLHDSRIGNDPHLLENVKLAVLPGEFAVAENGCVWITSDVMGDRALPFICERLALVVSEDNILPTLYEAYEEIDDRYYDFGAFIAGPSKTADIEQSLVLGAHGPKTMTLFLLKNTDTHKHS